MKALEKIAPGATRPLRLSRRIFVVFLDDEPIEARPPSRIYRFRKVARRNKVALTTGSMVLAALVLGTGVSAWQGRSGHARPGGGRRFAPADGRFRGATQDGQCAGRYRTRPRRRRALGFGLRRLWDSCRAATGPLPGLVGSRISSPARRLWKEAAADYARAMDLGAPATNPGWWGVPLLFAYTGDEEHYRDAYAQLLAQLGKSQDSFTLLASLRSCLATPESLDVNYLVKRSEQLLAEPPSGQGGSRSFGGRPPPAACRVFPARDATAVARSRPAARIAGHALVSKAARPFI